MAHRWSADPGRSTRLHADVFENPVRCECGAKGWRFGWGDVHVVSGVVGGDRDCNAKEDDDEGRKEGAIEPETV